jgi:hypothetical protein
MWELGKLRFLIGLHNTCINTLNQENMYSITWNFLFSIVISFLVFSLQKISNQKYQFVYYILDTQMVGWKQGKVDLYIVWPFKPYVMHISVKK